MNGVCVFVCAQARAPKTLLLFRCAAFIRDNCECETQKSTDGFERQRNDLERLFSFLLRHGFVITPFLFLCDDSDTVCSTSMHEGLGVGAVYRHLRANSTEIHQWNLDLHFDGKDKFGKNFKR